MGHALPSHTKDEFRVAAVRDTLEKIRELALQSKLLALNTAVESAQTGHADTLAEQAQHALTEASRVATAVDSLLQQLNASMQFAKHARHG